MKSTLKSLTDRIFLIVIILLMYGISGAQTHYVSPAALGAADGSSWTDAYTDLQQAIDTAGTGDSIFVAEGVYLSSRRHSGDSLRHSTFYIDKTISLFGGFSGIPGTEGGFEDRDVSEHPTILSGDLGIPGDAADNAFHVLYLDHVSDSTRIDGFTIAYGDGRNGAGYEAIGAGIFNNAIGGHSSPTLVNCIIRDNTTNESGGGMHNQAENGGVASPILVNCSFIGNTASGGGGYSSYADAGGKAKPLFINCRFQGNSGATAGGSAIQIISHSAESSPVVINSILSGNHAPTSGPLAVFVTGTGVSNTEISNTAISGNTGSSLRVVDLGLKLSTVSIRNSILWGNSSPAPSTNGATVDASFSIIPFGFPGEGVLGLDPMYVTQPPLLDSAHVLGDLHLLPGSPAFDAGNNAALPAGVTTDLDNLPRFINALTGGAGNTDIGPYEFQGNTTGIAEEKINTLWRAFPNPTSGLVNIVHPEKWSPERVIVFDQTGKNLTAKASMIITQDQMTLNLCSFPSGYYFVCLTSGEKTEAIKVIVQHP